MSTGPSDFEIALYDGADTEMVACSFDDNESIQSIIIPSKCTVLFNFTIEEAYFDESLYDLSQGYYCEIWYNCLYSECTGEYYCETCKPWRDYQYALDIYGIPKGYVSCAECENGWVKCVICNGTGTELAFEWVQDEVVAVERPCSGDGINECVKGYSSCATCGGTGFVKDNTLNMDTNSLIPETSEYDIPPASKPKLEQMERVKCDECDGKGHTKCTICDGSGYIKVTKTSYAAGNSSTYDIKEKCVCEYGQNICYTCEGTGKVYKIKEGYQ